MERKERMIEDRVISVLAKSKKLPPEKITLESSFLELGMDSLDALEFLFALEEEFDVDIPNDAAEEMQTVAQAVAGLEKLLAASEGATETEGSTG